MQRWGLGYEALREANPGLVMLSTSLMGQTGRFSAVAGYGNIGAAFAGFQQLVGWPDELPVGPYGPYTDYVGPRFAIVALLGALDHRRRTGEGCHLDISQAEAGMQFLAPQIADYSVTGRIAQHEGNRDAQMAPHGVFRCRGTASSGAIVGTARTEPSDQHPAWVAIAVRSDAEWQALAATGRRRGAGAPIRAMRRSKAARHTRTRSRR